MKFWAWNNLANDQRYANVLTAHKKWLPKKKVPWQIDESKNWIYTREIWDDATMNEKK